MQKRICFVEPHYGWFAEQLDPPFPLMYLAAVAEKCGWQASIIDMQNLETPLPDVDVYAVTATSPQWATTLKLADRLAKEHPYSLKIVGGNHVSAAPLDAEASKFDLAVMGEGEKALEAILANPRKWKSKQTQFMHGESVQNLDSIPFPARHLIDWSQYKRGIFWGKQLIEPAVGILQSRGCPGVCCFCGSQIIFGHKTRYRSVQNVISEMKEVITTLGYHGFNFHDDTFTLNHERVKELCGEFQKLDVVWRCLTRVNTVNEEILELMKNSGCKEIIYGLESGSQAILNNLHKGTTVKQNIQAMKLTKKTGIQTKAGIIVGSPGETWETVEETKKMLRECPPDFWNVSVFTPYPGCDVANNPDKYNVKILTRNIEEYAMVSKTLRGNVVMETEKMKKADIEQARDELIELCLSLGGYEN